jgi:hypothetical protein
MLMMMMLMRHLDQVGQVEEVGDQTDYMYSLVNQIHRLLPSAVVVHPVVVVKVVHEYH